MDNFTFCPTDNPRHGYVAQLRKGGLGDLDIYRVIFEEEEQKQTAVVVQLEIMMGPEKETITFHEWKEIETGEVKWFTDEFQPFDLTDRFEFVETKNLEIKNGEAYEITIIGSFDGAEVAKYTPENFPKEGVFQWYDTRVKKVKIPAKKFEPTLSSIKGLTNLEITATAEDNSGEMIGTYLPNYNTGNLVFTFFPGQVYEITIDAPGFQTVKEKVVVDGLGNFQSVIMRTVTLVEEGLEVPGK